MGMKITAQELYQLEQYVLTNYINKLIEKDDRNSYIKESNLLSLNLKNEELAYIKQVLIKHNIYLIPQTQEEKITSKDRSKRVANYNYGEIESNNFQKNDVPVMATLKYDSLGNLIYENWEKLDKFLEEDFIPDFVTMKQRKDKETKEITYFPSIQLNKITQLQLCEAEVKHVITYLGKQGIRVGGTSAELDGEFENYDYINTYKDKEKTESISPEETIQKLKRYKQNPTKELRDEIIIDNMRLASFLAYRYAVHTNLDMHELESYAYEGLIDAVEGFNPDLGYKFSTYAYPTIRGNILNGIPELQGYKNGDFYTNFIQAKLAVEEELETTIEESPEIIDEIVELLVVTGKIAEKNAGEIRTKILLSMPQSLDLMMDDKEVSPDNSNEYLSNDYINEELAQDNLLYLEIAKKMTSEAIYKILDTLTPKERNVIIERFGLEDGIHKTLEKTGYVFGTTREGVRQITDKAFRKMKHPSRSRKIIDLFLLYDEYNYEPDKIIEARTGIAQKKHIKHI